MYRPPAFREDRCEILDAAIRTHPLATLVTQGREGLTANLIPFTLVVAADGARRLRAHMAKANGQIADLRDGAEALVIFQGPQAYVTPSWYSAKREHGKVVPTWNYVVVQARGRPLIIDAPDWLRTQIHALTTQQEQGLAEPWTVDDAPADFVAGQLKGIVGLEIPVERIEGKWKISQNQSPANHAGVMDGLRDRDPASAMAAMMER